MNKIIINLIGTGSRVFRINPSTELLFKLKDTASRMKTSLELAFFDADFFSKLGDPNYKSLDDISNEKIQGLMNDSKSQVEIRTKGKKKRMISFQQLLHQQSLLPLYNIEFEKEIDEIKRAIVVVEKEVGLISCFEIMTEKFDLDKMKFEVTEIDTGIEKLQILTGITYSEQRLYSVSDDTLVTSCYSIINIL